MYSLWLACRGSDRERLVAELWEAGTLGIVEHDEEIQAFFERQFPAGRYEWQSPRWQLENEHDWVAESRENWEPVLVGERFFLSPEWRSDAAPAGRLRLTARAGAASGSGYSTPTQLAIEALERHVKPGDAVFDAGTGSGILAAASLLLGAGKVFACDIDPDAVSQAYGNLAADGLRVLLYAGSPRSSRGGFADVVIANLNAITILGLARELTAAARPGGTLVLCGLRSGRFQEVHQAIGASGGTETGLWERDGWACLSFRATGPSRS